jgi:hypothetical protein
VLSIFFMKAIGIVLVVLGLVGLLFGRISWTDRDTVVDAGPIQVQTEERKRLPIPPIAGGIMLVAGIVLLIKK